MFTQLTKTVVSAQAFSCHNTPTSGCQAAFSSGRTLLPLLRNVMTILGWLPSAHVQNCSVHSLFSNLMLADLSMFFMLISRPKNFICFFGINDERYWRLINVETLKRKKTAPFSIIGFRTCTHPN